MNLWTLNYLYSHTSVYLISLCGKCCYNGW